MSDDTPTPDPIEAAREAGRAEALAVLAGEMVESAFRAAVVGRRGVDADHLLTAIDRRKFLADDGTVDHTRINAFLTRIATPANRRLR